MAHLRPSAVSMLLFVLGLVSCQPMVEPLENKIAEHPVADKSSLPADETKTERIDWTAPPDCIGMLVLLRRGLADGTLETLDGTPFALVAATGDVPAPGWPSISRRIGQGPTDASSDPKARCLLRSGAASDHRAEHRVLGRELVRSEYQSGSRKEQNPAYDAAKARLRKAEREAKPGKSSMIKVGDPLIDLVGLLVGGAITSASQWGAGDQVEEAIDTLMATPRSIQQPIYRPYQFERAHVRASRAATIPITLTDRTSRKSWRTSLRRREVREFAVLDGLDRRDRDYEAHQANSLTEKGLRQWEAEWPLPELGEMVAGLLNPGAADPVKQVTMLGSETASDHGAVIDGGMIDSIESIDAAIVPAFPANAAVFEARQRTGRVPDTGLSPEEAARSAIVDILDQGRQGQGVYVRSGFVLASSDAVGDRGLIDVEDPGSGALLGLVAGVDRNRGLALIQTPRADHPVALLPGQAPDGMGMADQPVHRAASYAHRSPPASRSQATAMTWPKPSGNTDSFPLFEGGYLVGIRNRRGIDVPMHDIQSFLDDQAHLLPDR